MILDTNAVSDIFAGDAVIEKVLAASERHHLPVTVIGEYRYALLHSTHRRRLALLLESLIRESVVLPVDEATATIYAQVRSELRGAGHPIPENDVWIAALSRQHDQPIVSRDEHFDRVSGVKRIGW